MFCEKYQFLACSKEIILTIFQIHSQLYNIGIVLIDIFPGVQLDRQSEDDLHSSHCCLVAIGRLQVTSTAK
jgi:hypothetical protein